MAARVKRNDTVMIIAGKERGKVGKVLRVLPAANRVVVERLNLVKRHLKPRGPQSPGGVLEKEAPLHLSNVMPMCECCNAPVRVGHRILEDCSKARVCRRCGEFVDKYDCTSQRVLSTTRCPSADAGAVVHEPHARPALA